MKYLLSVLRILIGVFGGIFIILVVLFVIFFLTYKPAPIYGSGLFRFPGSSDIGLFLTFYGTIWSGVITLFLTIIYFISKYFLKNKAIVK